MVGFCGAAHERARDHLSASGTQPKRGPAVGNQAICHALKESEEAPIWPRQIRALAHCPVFARRQLVIQPPLVLRPSGLLRAHGIVADLALCRAADPGVALRTEPPDVMRVRELHGLPVHTPRREQDELARVRALQRRPHRRTTWELAVKWLSLVDVGNLSAVGDVGREPVNHSAARGRR